MLEPFESRILFSAANLYTFDSSPQLSLAGDTQTYQRLDRTTSGASDLPQKLSAPSFNATANDAPIDPIDLP
jgi:hypothetical protein